MKEGTLVASRNPGRYALGDGPDLTSGTALAIEIGGQWIEGRVEYALALYVNMGPRWLFETPQKPAVIDGYYFVAAHDGSMCGLCVGMWVRIL
jgi:hypothetical protein